MKFYGISAEAIGVTVLVLVLFAVQWAWNWQTQKELRRVQLEIDIVKDKAGWDEERLNKLVEQMVEEKKTGQEDLDQLMDRLGSDNVLTRYDAGMKIRKRGDSAVPPLLESVESGDKNSREAALLLLNDMEIPDRLMPKVRTMAKEHLNTEASEEETAGLLSLLAEKQDTQSLPLFKKAVSSSDKPLFVAGMRGMRKLEAVQFLPSLLKRYPESDDLLQREIAKTVKSLSKDALNGVKDQLDELSPKQRFTLIQIMKDANAPEPKAILEHLSRNSDDRVALAAAKALANRGYGAAFDQLRKLSKKGDSKQIRDAAEKLLESLTE